MWFMIRRRISAPSVSQGTLTPQTSWNFSRPKYKWWKFLGCLSGITRCWFKHNTIKWLWNYTLLQMSRSGSWQQHKWIDTLGWICSSWWVTHDLGSFCTGYKMTMPRGTVSTPVTWQRHTIFLIATSETPIRGITSMAQKRLIYPQNPGVFDSMGIKTRPVGGEKKGTSVPNALCGVRMVLLGQEKIPIAKK